jgi:hypothetical protein
MKSVLLIYLYPNVTRLKIFLLVIFSELRNKNIVGVYAMRK